MEKRPAIVIKDDFNSEDLLDVIREVDTSFEPEKFGGYEVRIFKQEEDLTLIVFISLDDNFPIVFKAVVLANIIYFDKFGVIGLVIGALIRNNIFHEFEPEIKVPAKVISVWQKEKHFLPIWKSGFKKKTAFFISLLLIIKFCNN